VIALLGILLNVLAPEAQEEAEQFDVIDSVSELHSLRHFSMVVELTANL